MVCSSFSCFLYTLAFLCIYKIGPSSALFFLVLFTTDSMPVRTFARIFCFTVSSGKYKCQLLRIFWLLLTLINPVSVPQKIMSFAVNKLVILLPADSLPTFCCFSLNHTYHKFRIRIMASESSSILCSSSGIIPAFFSIISVADMEKIRKFMSPE